MSEPELFTIGEVAAILGVSTHTVRAWERRHGMVHPLRTNARQRRYRAEDLDLLRDVQRAMTVDGLSVKRAYQAVSGDRKQAPSQTSTARSGRSEPWTLPGVAGVWRAVADTLSQLIVIVDSEGMILEANVVAAKTFDTTRQRLAGRSFADLVDPFDRSKAVLLYRPHLRTVKNWELNLWTEQGSRLYSFESRPVRHEGTTSLALVGSEMFADPPQSSISPGSELSTVSISVPSGDRPRDTTVANAFEAIVDQLPFGLAVTTIGPEPRVVFANRRLARTLGISRGAYTGRPLSELIPAEAASQALQDVVAAKAAITLRGVRTTHRHVNIGLRPLLSSDGKVTSVLVVIEDATAEATQREELSRLVADQRFEAARTDKQLARVGLEHLTSSMPDVDFAIALTSPSHPGGAPEIRSSTAGWGGIGNDLADGLAGDAIRQAVAGGTRVEIRISDGAFPFVVSVMPLVTGPDYAAQRRLGAIAWRRPADKPLSREQLRIVDACMSRLAYATELQHVRAEAAQKANRLASVVTAASVVGGSAVRTGLGVRFLKQLTRALALDGASIGRVVGSDYVIDAAYAPGGAHAKPGDRFPLADRFVSESVRTGRPATSSHLASPRLPAKIKKALAPMRRGLSVPLILDGRVMGVVTLSRKTDVPFDQEDVLFTQTLSSVALLAVTLSGRDR